MGTYNVLFKPHHISGRNPTFTVDNIIVEAKSKKEIVHNFETGFFQVTVKNKSELLKSVVSIYQDGEVVYSKRTSESVSSNPRNIHLIPGIYNVKIAPFKLDTKPQEFQINIKQGKTIEKLIEF